MNNPQNQEQFADSVLGRAAPVADPETAAAKAAAKAYWKANLKLLGTLLTVWFAVSFGFGILLVEPLNTVSFLGVKLGFWFAQQGSIYVFVALIFVYAVRMKKLERDFGVDD